MRNSEEKTTTAVILAAGYGKRLRPYTLVTPKPLLNVCGKPVIDSVFKSIVAAEFTDVIVVLGYKAGAIREFVASNYGDTLNLSFVTQDNISGSAIGLEQAKKEITRRAINDFLVVAADYLLPKYYLKELVDCHANGAQDITLSLRPISINQIPESSYVELDKNYYVTFIHEKPKEINGMSDPIASSLIYILPLESFRYLPKLEISERGEKELPSLINQMIKSGFIAKGVLQENLQDWEAKYKEEHK